MMNQKAEDLGMDNTHFENATGLHDENHYTTVKDLAALLSYTLENDTFREILGGKTGYTEEVGLCLASLSKKGKQEYILISAGAEGDPYTEG